MSFFDESHRRKIREIDNLWQSLHALEDLAKQNGINDIFQDNGAKVLQQLIYLNFNILSGREGNDAISENGTEWEMKSINIETKATGFSTNHHTNHIIIEKYRKVPWSFAIYRGSLLEEIYVMSPTKLEPLFLSWEKKLINVSHLNNPKIPIKFVKKYGVKIYPFYEPNPINPENVVKN